MLLFRENPIAGKLKVSLKRSCFAKLCQKSCSGPDTRILICTSCGAKKPSPEQVNATFNVDDQKSCRKAQCLFQFTPKLRF